MKLRPIIMWIAMSTQHAFRVQFNFFIHKISPRSTVLSSVTMRAALLHYDHCTMLIRWPWRSNCNKQHRMLNEWEINQNVNIYEHTTRFSCSTCHWSHVVVECATQNFLAHVMSRLVLDYHDSEHFKNQHYQPAHHESPTEAINWPAYYSVNWTQVFFSASFAIWNMKTIVQNATGVD